MTEAHQHEDEHEHHHHDFQPKHMIVVTPGILVDDVTEAAEYYRDVLGFEIRFFDGDGPNFSIVDRGDVSVHIAKSNPPGRRNGLGAAGSGNGSDFYIVVTAIDELYEELTGRGARVLLEPTDWPHGMREFVVEDNNGYRMIFGEPVGGFEHEHDHED
jgi:uncharacterized glyoxalase superfamily protein PhnB